MDLKENFATNLIKFRKSAKLTQAELAEKLNYTDKAVSKWERGESVPDIYTLKNIADFFSVSVDSLIDTPTADVPQISISPKKNIFKQRLLISLCSVGLVWLVAMCCYSFLDIIIPSITHTWLSFIYALPVSFIVLTVFTSIWHKKLFSKIIISCLVWSTLLAVFLSVYILSKNSVANLWELFLIGIPLQCLIVFWYFLTKVK